MFLQIWEAQNKHIYKLPIIASAIQLKKKWRNLQNKLHDNPEFEIDLTQMEKKYLKLIRHKNKTFTWDISGKWCSPICREGAGIVLDGNIYLGYS